MHTQTSPSPPLRIYSRMKVDPRVSPTPKKAPRSQNVSPSPPPPSPPRYPNTSNLFGDTAAARTVLTLGNVYFSPESMEFKSKRSASAGNIAKRDRPGSAGTLQVGGLANFEQGQAHLHGLVRKGSTVTKEVRGKRGLRDLCIGREEEKRRGKREGRTRRRSKASQKNFGGVSEARRIISMSSRGGDGGDQYNSEDDFGSDQYQEDDEVFRGIDDVGFTDREEPKRSPQQSKRSSRQGESSKENVKPAPPRQSSPLSQRLDAINSNVNRAKERLRKQLEKLREASVRGRDSRDIIREVERSAASAAGRRK